MKLQRICRRIFSAALLCTALGAAVADFAASQTLAADGVVKSIQEGMQRSKQSGLPLLVFGLSDTCTRCQGLKQAVESSAEYQLLISQYVVAEIPFGGRDFGTAFGEIVTKDPSIPPAIGAPSVFVYTSAGKVVYAGPDRPEGMKPDEKFKEVLIAGIRENGGLRLAEASVDPALRSDLAKARQLISEKQMLAAATLMGKYVDDKPAAEESNELIELTGLKAAKSKFETQRDSLIEELTQHANSSIQQAIALGKADKPIMGAVRLIEVSDAFADYPGLAASLDTAWQEINQKVGPQAREQALLVAGALGAERSGDVAKAIGSYEKVVLSFPGTQAAELSQIRIEQLRPADTKQMRRWTSKDGKFSVEAVLLSREGDQVRLKNSSGKILNVPASALSADDLKFIEQK